MHHSFEHLFIAHPPPTHPPLWHSSERAMVVCPAVKTPFFSSLSRPTVALCSSSEDPRFLKFLIFTQKIGNFVECRHSKSPFSPEFQLFSSKFLDIAVFKPALLLQKSLRVGVFSISKSSAHGPIPPR